MADAAVIIESARDATSAKVAALDLGADDYVSKPFDNDEVLARIRTALRHRMANETGTPLVRVGDVEIDLAARIVRQTGERRCDQRQRARRIEVHRDKGLMSRQRGPRDSLPN